VAVGDGKLLNSTVSIGVHCAAGSGTPVETMLSRADAALYKAKQSGRNRVECA
jgi:diguanylate cyclase (GGDEF)-like protein